MRRLTFLNSLALGLLFSFAPAHSYVTSKLTFSTGYYEDQEKQDHSIIFFDWRFRNVTGSGSELAFDLGLNNSLILDEWGLYPYRAAYTFALGSPLRDASHLKSQITIGRMSLLEAPEISLIDGFQLKYYQNANNKLNLYGGAASYLEQSNTFSLDSHIYGADYTFGRHHRSFKLGYQGGLREGNWKHYSYGSFYWKPSKEWSLRLLGNGKFNHTNGKRVNIQSRAQFELLPTVLVSLTHREQEPEGHVINGRSEIYNIFAKNLQQSHALATSWDLQESTFNFSASLNSYMSQSKEEKGEEFTLSWDKYAGKHGFSPSLVLINSYGGKLVSYGIKYHYSLSDETKIKMDFEISDFTKINGIENVAYHLRSGVDWNFMQDLRTLVLVELERNHIFNFDGRAIIYASYFYY